MIDYILCAEFDDLKGRVMRCCYPSSIPDIETKAPGAGSQSFDDKILELCLPDSGNDRMIDTCYFMLNCPQGKDISQ
jgi:hypothetical protein